MPSKHMRVKAMIAPAGVADDLKRIKGIGPAIEKRLYAAGIHSYADLAKLTPAQVADRVGGLSAAVVAKKRWIKQAAGLASEFADRPLHRARFRIDLMLDDNGRVQYTRVKHIRHDEDEAEPNKWDDGWGKWDETTLISFFVQQAGIRPQPIRASLPTTRTESTLEKKGAHTREFEAGREMTSEQGSDKAELLAEAATPAPLVTFPVEAAAPVEQSVEQTPKLIEVHDSLQLQTLLQRPFEAPAQVSLVATPIEPGPKLQLTASDMQIVDSSIRGLRAQFGFQLSGAKANELAAAQVSYFVQILACDLSTGYITVLATDKQMLQLGSLLYAPTADFALPEIGRYQTLGVIFLSIPNDNSIPDRARVDVAWGPILNIIP